jgi:hypothetical protein
MVDDARAPAGFMAGATKPPKARKKARRARRERKSAEGAYFISQRRL